MKIDPPMNMNNKGYVNLPLERNSGQPSERNPEQRDTFDDILHTKKTIHKRDQQLLPLQDRDNVNYNRAKPIGSDALSFLETPLLGSTSIQNTSHKNFPNEGTDRLRDEVKIKTGQFNVQLEEILSDFDDTKVDITATNTNTQSINPATIITSNNDIRTNGNKQINVSIANPVNIKTKVNKATQNNINATQQKHNAQSHQQYNKTAASLSEIAAKVFQDKLGLHLVLKTGKLNDREIEDLEARVMQLLGEFNIKNPKLDILSKQEKE